MHREDHVKANTVEKVMAAAKELGYRPQQAVRSIGGARSYLLGLIYDNPTVTYVADMMAGALEEARKEGYHLVIEPCKDSYDPGYPGELKELVIQSNLDGVILAPPLCDQTSVLETLRELKIPYARIAPSVELSNDMNIFMDDYKASKEMTRHLIELGHSNIAFITGRKGTSTTEKRYNGFIDGMNEAGLEIPSHNVITGDYTYKSGMECAEKLLSGDEKPSAIFASNDDMASAVIATAHKHDINIPTELSIVGFDDSAIASVVWPTLTTVRQPIREMAAAAVNMLITNALRPQSGNPVNSECYLDFEIIKRDSASKVFQS